MVTSSSDVYFALTTNALFTTSFGIILPWIVHQEARRIRYMQNFKGQLFARMLFFALLLIGGGFALDIVNKNMWPIQMAYSFWWLFAALFFTSFTITCWNQRHVLRSLYPKEDFIIEQELRARLLRKLQTCDETMPLPRFESQSGVINYANRAAQNMLEYSLKELHLMPAANLVHTADKARVLALLLSKSHDTYECRIITASGRVVYVEVRTTHDPYDESIRITFLTDVTNYVEQRDRFLREFKLQRSTEARRVAEADLLTELSQPAHLLG